MCCNKVGEKQSESRGRMMGESNKTNCLLVVALAVIERDVEGGG